MFKLPVALVNCVLLRLVSAGLAVAVEKSKGVASSVYALVFLIVSTPMLFLPCRSFSARGGVFVEIFEVSWRATCFLSLVFLRPAVRPATPARSWAFG